MATDRSHPDDYKVAYLREDHIADTALQWRQAAGVANQPWFNIASFMTDVLRIRIKRPFEIEFFNGTGQKRAFVTFRNKRLLYVDRETWEQADLGDPESTFVLAHETGHLLFHDHHAKAFSTGAGQLLEPWDKEESAEWQANTFAFHFLLPDHIVQSIGTINEIAKSCRSTYALVKKRLDWCRPVRVAVDVCSRCGNFSLASSGHCTDDACARQRNSKILINSV
jgi:hypothetical protein